MYWPRRNREGREDGERGHKVHAAQRQSICCFACGAASCPLSSPAVFRSSLKVSDLVVCGPRVPSEHASGEFHIETRIIYKLSSRELTTQNDLY